MPISARPSGCTTGEKADVTMYFPSELLDVARDRFGAMKPQRAEDGYIVRVTVRVSRTFFAWITTFEGKVKILEPQSVKNRYTEFITNLYKSLN